MAETVSYKHFITVGKEMRKIDNHRLTLVEAVDIVSERDPGFPKLDFIAAVATDLHHNGLIKDPTAWALCVLDSRILSERGRNYATIDMLDSVGSHFYIREKFPRVSLEIVRNDSERIA